MTYHNSTETDISTSLKVDGFKVDVTIKNGMLEVIIDETLISDSITVIHRYKEDKGQIRVFNDGIIRTDSKIEKII